VRCVASVGSPFNTETCKAPTGDGNGETETYYFKVMLGMSPPPLCDTDGHSLTRPRNGRRARRPAFPLRPTSRAIATRLTSRLTVVLRWVSLTDLVVNIVNLNSSTGRI
jgi:hypothetical protein